MSDEQRLTNAQARILRTLYDAETGFRHTSSLRHGLHSSAAALVRKGWIWKEDRGFYRPLYGMTDEGNPAAKTAWER